MPILKALNGHGPKASDFNKYWQGGGLGYKGVEYNIGPTPDELVLNLVNEQEYVTTPLWNVIGVINGTISDEVVVLGNHRDAWIAGGAGDPNSGSAALNEVVRGFGKALEAGWRPLRTIVFASWDGEEYGLIGSTEWVEDKLPWLSKASVAYLNLDVGTRGPHFQAAASPLLNKAVYEATSLVQSPNQTVKGQTVRDTWNGHIDTMGSGSDFTAFQDLAGIPSIDIGFGGSRNDPVYQYHSNYDSFKWMETYGDPGWHYHATISRVWGILTAIIVETPVIGFKTTDYADGLKTYLDSVVKKAETLYGDNSDSKPTAEITALEAAELRGTISPSASTSTITSPPSFSALFSAIASLHEATVAFDNYTAALATHLASPSASSWKFWKRAHLYYKVRKANKKLKYFERHFLSQEGLDGRPWFKHVVFAPGRWTGYAGATYPGLVESLEDGNLIGVGRWEERIRGLIKDAEASLR